MHAGTGLKDTVRGEAARQSEPRTRQEEELARIQLYNAAHQHRCQTQRQRRLRLNQLLTAGREKRETRRAHVARAKVPREVGLAALSSTERSGAHQLSTTERLAAFCRDSLLALFGMLARILAQRATGARRVKQSR